MLYIPFIKLKSTEIRLSGYSSKYLMHKSIIPFFELIYEVDNKGANKKLSDFTKNIPNKEFFIGIPHKPSALVHKEKLFFTQANKNPFSYYMETDNLFSIQNAIPVFYVYGENDYNYVRTFIEHANKLNRRIGILTTTDAITSFDISKLKQTDYLFIDLDTSKLSTKRVSLNDSLSQLNHKIILVRENRNVKFMNTTINNGEKAPFEPDLSYEIRNNLPNFDFEISGFGDYCGSKNTTATSGGGGNRSNMYPAWAMYKRDISNPMFLGIKSSISMDFQKESFEELKQLSLNKLMTQNGISKTTTIQMLNVEKSGTYAFWNVLTEWHYLSQMFIFDEWKNI